jgi:hypothetical protein
MHLVPSFSLFPILPGSYPLRIDAARMAYLNDIRDLVSNE